ncbi:MAG: L,D-transpeptidase [Gemmatimonadota bacterium]|nr:L,D-transpeptidase [Gemmatimonadota bacterium]
MLLLSAPALATAQGAETRRADSLRLASSDSLLATNFLTEPGASKRDSAFGLIRASTKGYPTSEADSLDWLAARGSAERAKGFRVVVSMFDRRLWVIRGADTLMSAPVAVATRASLEFGDSSWVFDTPRGTRTVRSKRANPLWTPPIWHYAEVAKSKELKLAFLSRDNPEWLSDGSRIAVRGREIGLVTRDLGTFQPLPADEEIVFDSTLYVPPLGTRNRRIDGELGKYRLDLGDGYLLHGTPHIQTIGDAATHGCVRLTDEDIQWLYRHVPVGTRVYIY